MSGERTDRRGAPDMTEKSFETSKGTIRYWVNDLRPGRLSLVFLPGLTADHRLFGRQIEAFEEEFNVFVWDAPGHAASRPFSQDFSLMDKAAWLRDILLKEGIERPVLIGQSMGGYVSQCFMQSFPGGAAGFVSIDSAPLSRSDVTGWEIWLLKRTEPMYRAFPGESLKRFAARSCSTTEYGRNLMREMLACYTRDEYCRLSAHGMKLLAGAMEADLPYEPGCPVVLICGDKDRAGSAKSYNRRWAAKEGLPIHWIKGAGHNANADRPDEVNGIIREFAAGLAPLG